MSTTDITRGIGPLTERQMVAHAKARGLVRLVDGQAVTLCSWGTKAGRNKIRVEGSDGKTRWTAYKTDVIEMLDVFASASGDREVKATS